MRLLISTAIALTAALVAAGPAIDLAAAAPKPKTALPRVEITFADDPSHNLQSDGGPYEDGQNGVTAYIDSTGHLIFGSGAGNGPGPIRQLFFSFEHCTDVPCLPLGYELPVGAPHPFGYARAGFIVGVRGDDGNALPGRLLGMPVNENKELRSGINLTIPLDDDPDYWTLCLTPTDVTGFCALSDHSTPARIIRKGLGDWTIFATTTEVGELINENDQGRPRIIEFLGTYSMPFSFDVHCVANCPTSAPS